MAFKAGRVSNYTIRVQNAVESARGRFIVKGVKMKLKPCPFCGSEPHASTDGENYFIECGNLNCINVCVEDRRDKAIRLWNTRAEESKAEPSTTATDNVNHPSHYETNGWSLKDGE